MTPLEDNGWFGNSSEPSDYGNGGTANDIALSFSDDSNSYYSMKNNVTFTNGSTLMGDVVLIVTLTMALMQTLIPMVMVLSTPAMLSAQSVMTPTTMV